MIAVHQRLLPLRMTIATRPLLHLSAVRAALGLDEDQVIELFDDGLIAWVWDIAGRNRRCKEYRVLPAAMDAYLDQESGVRGQESGVRNQEAGVRSQESGVTDQESVLRLALPSILNSNFSQLSAPIRLHALALHWVCSQQHLGNLVEEGLLEWSTGTAHKAIMRESAIAFLKSRRIA